MNARRMAGFTLVELLVTIAIIGVLVAIGLPQYDNYMTKGKLAEAMSLLSDLQVRQEQYYQDNRAYANGMTPRAAGSYFTTTSCTTSGGGQNYTCTANAPTLNYTYTVTDAGVKQTIKPDGSTAPCWVKTPGGAC